MTILRVIVNTYMHCINGRGDEIGIVCMMTILTLLAFRVFLTKSLLKMHPLKENIVQY